MNADRPRALSWPFVFVFSFFLTLILFGWTIADGPIVDDNLLLILTQVHRFGDLSRVLIPDAGTYWRPLAKLSLTPLSSIFGMATWPHRLVALLLHTIAATLVFALGRLLFGARAAVAATLIFLMHPLHAGTVHWISARPDLLATVFVLAALVSFTRGVRDPSFQWTAAATAFAGCAYFSKEVSFVTPGLMFLVGLVALSGSAQPQTRRLMRELTGPTLLLIGVLVLRFTILGGFGGPATLRRPLPGVTLGNLIRDVPRALILPINQAAAPSALAWPAAVVLTALMCLLVWLVFRQRKSFNAFFGICFALLAALPMAPFLYTGANLEAGYMLYLPSAGFALWLGALLFSPSMEGRSSWPAAALAVLLVSYAPLLQLHLRAHHRAAETARRMVQAVLENPNAGRASTWLVDAEPRQVEGVPLFYDHLDQLFWRQDKAQNKSVLLVGQNFWRGEGRSLRWRDARQRRELAVLQWRSESGPRGFALADLTASTMAVWAVRAANSDSPVRVSFVAAAPASAEAIPGGVRWWHGPISLPVQTSPALAAANTLALAFALRTLDPRAAKEAAFDWIDQKGEPHRVLFAVIDDGRPHAYVLALAVDPRWARTTALRRAALHLPFVAGEVRFTE